MTEQETIALIERVLLDRLVIRVSCDEVWTDNSGYGRVNEGRAVSVSLYLRGENEESTKLTKIDCASDYIQERE